MNTFSVKELFGQELEKLRIDSMNSFSGFDEEVFKRGFAVPEEINYGGLMFVGINPSYDPDKDKGPGYYPLYEEEIYRYFAPFRDISGKVGLDWSHVDLMFIRERNQKFIENTKKGTPFLAFLQKQYFIAKQIIRKAKPEIIVVNNTLARKWLMGDKALENRFVFDEELGTHKIVGGDLDGTPVFFTCMLTGGHMDTGTFERLVWHIKFVLKKIRG